MKYLLIAYLLLITHSLYAAIGCRDATNLANANDCFFKIESSIPNKVIINPSFDLNNYKILYNKENSFDEEGRPEFPLFGETNYSALTGQAKTNSPISILNGGDKLQITGSGYYRIRLKNTTDNNIHWSQWVYVPYPEPANARVLAEKYMPIISFADGEEYFPRKIEDILNHTGSMDSNLNIKLKISDFTGNTTVQMGNSIIDFLTNKGSNEFIIDKDSNGRKLLQNDTNEGEQNPVVYYHAIETGGYIYLSYYYFYSFDPKSGHSSNPASGAHGFDREGLIITLKKDANQQITPLSVTYGSHVDFTPSDYWGCKDDKNLENCEQEKNLITTINNGKAKLNWSHIPKEGDHIIAYAAKGSHALYPAYGWYEVGIGFLNTIELAGNFNSFNTRSFAPSNLIKIDNTSVFAFSGYWVEGSVVNSKFPPFIRYPDDWAPRPNTVSFYDTCLNGGDQSDQCIRLKNYFPPANLIGLVKDKITITGKLTNIAFRNTNNPILVHFNGTNAEAIADANGAFSIEVNAVDASFLEPVLIFSVDTTTSVYWVNNFGSSSTINLGDIDFNDHNFPDPSLQFDSIRKSCPMP